MKVSEVHGKGEEGMDLSRSLGSVQGLFSLRSGDWL